MTKCGFTGRAAGGTLARSGQGEAKMILVWCSTAWDWILGFLDNKNNINMVTCSGGWPFLVSLVTFIPAWFKHFSNRNSQRFTFKALRIHFYIDLVL